MCRALIASIAALALESASFAQQTAASAGLGAASPLVQVERLIGDQYAGFKQSCLLVYGDGGYHREARRQEVIDNRPSTPGYWKSAEVFEGGIPLGTLQELKKVIESEEFRAVTGTVGDPSGLRPKLLYGPRGVTPRGDIDILTASVARPNNPQVFEVFLGNTHLENSLKSFVTWIDGVEKRKARPSDKAAANNCATSSSPVARSSWEPTTSLVAKPIFTPDPDYPIDERDARHAGTVLVEAIVNVDGSVSPVSVKRGINPVLDQKALEAVRKWVFAPARLIGVPVAVPMNVEVNFRPASKSD
jgi:TonB family protein